jgi:hypothetical protein
VRRPRLEGEGAAGRAGRVIKLMTSASFEGNLALGDDGGLNGADPGHAARGRQARRWFIGLLAAGAIIWAVFAWGVMPGVIRDAYAGHGPSVLVRAMEHKSNYAVEHYLGKWNRMSLGLLAAWLGAGGILLMTTSRWFARTVAGTATPGTLGAMRMLVCVILALVVARDFRLAPLAALPDSQRISMGVMDFFYGKLGLAHVVHNAAALETLKWVCFALCLVGAVGFKTRVVLPVLALMYLPLAGMPRSYFWFNHAGVVPWYCLVVLCFTRCGDGWSLDRLIRTWRGQPVVPAAEPRAHYGWARLAVWLVICLPYMAAGMSKLRNGTWFWWDGNNMQQILFTDGLRPEGDTPALSLLWLPGWFFALMGIGTILTEIGMITIPFWRKARLVLPLAMLGMHVGIREVMWINFYDLVYIQAIFYDWSPAVRWVSRKLEARRGTITLLFDGACPLCRRTVRVVTALDLFSRIDPVDFRTADLRQLSARHGVELDPARLEREMIVIKGTRAAGTPAQPAGAAASGANAPDSPVLDYAAPNKSARAYGGAKGARVIAGAVPALWVAWPFLAIPGLSHVAAAAYRKVAGNRMNLLACEPDGACAVAPAPSRTPGNTPAHAPVEYATPATHAAAVPPTGWLGSLFAIRRPLATAFILCLMLGCWSLRVEWYPFTSMQMFSSYTPHTVVSYYRTYATYEDGTPELVLFEDMGQGAPRYHPVLKQAFIDRQGKGAQACVDLMTRSANWWNANAAAPGRRVVRMETRHYQWDFDAERRVPDDQRGRVVDTIAVAVDPNAPAAAQQQVASQRASASAGQ